MKTSGKSGIISGSNTGFVRLYVLVVYFLVVGILAVYAFSPLGGEVGYILARLTPHLFYIPLVLTAIWYPDKKLAHIIIFSLIFLMLILGFLLNGWSVDAIFTVFTSFIYLWVFIAILSIPQIQVESIKKSQFPEKGGAGNSGTGGAVVQVPESLPVAPADETVYPNRIIPPTQITPLIESFRLGEDLVTRNTSAALRAIGDPSVPYIIRGMNSDSIAVRENCAKLLGEMKVTDSVDLLVDAMADPSRRVHNSATQALAKIGDPAVAALLNALKSDRWKIRAGAVVALRIMGLHDATPLLEDMLDDESHYVRKEVVKSLARIGREGVPDLLAGMLDDESRGVRLAAVGGLGRSGIQDAIAPLERVLEEEEDAEVRIRAVHSLEFIGTATAYEAMKQALNDRDPEVSAMAEEILRQNYKL